MQIPAMPPAMRAWASVIVGALFIAAGFGAGWMAQGWRLGEQIASMQAAAATDKAAEATTALNQLQRTAAAVDRAASAAIVDNTATARELRAIRQEMRRAKPLPPDCLPDAERLRRRNAAIEAYNRAATGSIPGSAVPDH